MGRQMAFWKYENGSHFNAHEVYEKACLEEETVVGLSLLPIGDILKKSMIYSVTMISLMT